MRSNIHSCLDSKTVSSSSENVRAVLANNLAAGLFVRSVKERLREPQGPLNEGKRIDMFMDAVKSFTDLFTMRPMNPQWLAVNFPSVILKEV